MDINRYKEGIQKFVSMLDGYLQGLWKSIDYDIYGIKSWHRILEERNIILVNFNDSGVFLNIHYKENILNNTIVITDISETISYIFGERGPFSSVYSSDVLGLIGYEIKGKSDKEMLTEELDYLKSQVINKKANIDTLRNDLNEEVEGLNELNRKIKSKLKLLEQL